MGVQEYRRHRDVRSFTSPDLLPFNEILESVSLFWAHHTTIISTDVRCQNAMNIKHQSGSYNLI
jgi:hypothetical protein